MKKLDYLIRRQFEQRGYMAGLSFGIQPTESQSKILFEDKKALKHYADVVENAIKGFQNILLEKYNKYFEIIIYEIYWFPLDTTSELMNYTTIRILSDYFSLDFYSFLSIDEAKQFHFLHDLKFEQVENNRFLLR
ncbi:hypothetical protein BWK59_02155 [Flavobacterium davisii]|uniref:Uncharacterized protein n=1 Tax=Flavobacterium davisii TaxID=2906077 RepID=A0A2D0AIV6_9FLAO|nr:hypothetical protein [Flavobacterium davisii]OWP85061.1 hypothetical protein BWK59_02155 [Flavobacterium davisii]